MEQFAGEGEHVETGAIALVEGLRISGHIDLIVLPDGTLQDYKFTSAFTVRMALSPDMHLAIYCHWVEPALGVLVDISCQLDWSCFSLLT